MFWLSPKFLLMCRFRFLHLFTLWSNFPFQSSFLLQVPWPLWHCCCAVCEQSPARHLADWEAAAETSAPGGFPSGRAALTTTGNRVGLLFKTTNPFCRSFRGKDTENSILQVGQTQAGRGQAGGCFKRFDSFKHSLWQRGERNDL